MPGDLRDVFVVRVDAQVREVGSVQFASFPDGFCCRRGELPPRCRRRGPGYHRAPAQSAAEYPFGEPLWCGAQPAQGEVRIGNLARVEQDGLAAGDAADRDEAPGTCRPVGRPHGGEVLRFHVVVVRVVRRAGIAQAQLVEVHETGLDAGPVDLLEDLIADR